jgi:Ser/Thr protein kinase RdoA (MazF antagonist)
MPRNIKAVYAIWRLVQTAALFMLALVNPLQAVLEQFAIFNAQITPLENSFNLNHRIQTKGKTYLLRQHRDPRHNVAALESEMHWLRHLAASGLEVQQPQPQVAGGLIAVLEGKPYSLLSWLEGEVFEVTETTEQAKAVGQLMARLHLANKNFVPPVGFTRLHYDVAFLETTAQKLEDIAWLAPEMPLYRAAFEFAKPAFVKPQTSLIHADLHAGNLLWRGQTVMALDFDACGFGALGFDLATALGYLEPELRPSFLESYENLHPLPSDFAAQKSRYTIGEWLNNLSFLAPREHERDYVQSVMVQGLREQLPKLMQPQS